MNIKLNIKLTQYQFALLIGISLLFLFFWSLPAASFVHCECREDRVLYLQTPQMKGDDVRSLQVILSYLGFYQGPLDGNFGKLTRKALISFQMKNHLLADGVVRDQIWEALGAEGHFLPAIGNSRPPEGELEIKINLMYRTLTLFNNGKPYRIYPVTVGKETSASPVGEWKIISKYERVVEGPLGSRWMGLNVPWGVYGIHGTNKPWEIGTAASLGCIRMHNLHVEELFNWVAVGTRVFIEGKREPLSISRVLKPEEGNQEVMQLQINLQAASFYQGYIDAAYGQDTVTAVKELEAQYGLRVDGIADWNIYYLIQVPGYK